MRILDFDEQDVAAENPPAVHFEPPSPKNFPPEEALKAQPRVEHMLTPDECLRLHNSNAVNGITSDQHAQALMAHGRNVLTPPKKTPLCLLFLAHLTGFFSLLLWAAAALCFLAYTISQDEAENLYLGIVLTIVVVLTGLFSFYQEYQSAAVMEAFKSFLPPRTRVIRDGAQLSVPSEELVPGDIVIIQAGDRIPADLRVLSAKGFKVDNSSLTGESLPQKRRVDNTRAELLEATNIAFYGTLCETGRATGLVISTGDSTVMGTIAQLTATTSSLQTPIAQEIHHFIVIISSVALLLGATFLIMGFVMGLPPIQNLVFAIGIIVANVPEGLLATVTVSLTLTAKRMAKKKVLVKNLEAVETLGSTTVIASDKTGTLTQNIMTVKHLYCDGCVYDARLLRPMEARAGDEGHPGYDRSSAGFERLKLIAALCNNASFDTTEANMVRPIQQRTVVGDASESALLKFAEADSALQGQAEGWVEWQRKANARLAEVPFASANKYHVTIHLVDNDPNKDRLLLTKGAPERVWARCDFMLVHGHAVPIEPFRDEYNQHLQGLMEAGERVLGMAYIELPANDFPIDFEYDTEAEEGRRNFPFEKGDGLVFAGVMSLQDPPRPSVPQAVLECRSAGVKVVMVTGDHPDTAEAIARQVKIVSGLTRKQLARQRGLLMHEVDAYDEDLTAVVVTGGELEKLSEDELDYILDFREVVFARTSPAQKLRIVQGLQAKAHIRRHHPDGQPLPVSHVVAVTGDGVNDAPALKAADIGVAMGIVGSDVAKNAADMILLNDNFASIVKGVEEGRLIFDNLKKSIAYTLSSNIPEISPFLVFILTQIPLPLPTVLILCIDLGTDMIPAISLAYESKEANIMEKPPRDMRVDRLVTAKLINFSYLQIGIIQAAAGFYAYLVVLMNFGFPPSVLPMRARWFMTGADTRVYTASELVSQGIASFADHPHPILAYCTDATTTSPITPVEPDAVSMSMSGCEYVKLGPCQLPGSSVCHDPSPRMGALQHAQTAFFIAIIVVQWADLIICRTRTLSLFQQGMFNGTLNFGLVSTLILGCLLLYTPPLNLALGTAPLHFVHWLPATPFCLVIFAYDEIRKLLIRRYPDGWVYKNTYY